MEGRSRFRIIRQEKLFDGMSDFNCGLSPINQQIAFLPINPLPRIYSSSLKSLTNLCPFIIVTAIVETIIFTIFASTNKTCKTWTQPSCRPDQGTGKVSEPTSQTSTAQGSGLLDGGVAFIQKPFSMSKLAEKLRDVLDLTLD